MAFFLIAIAFMYIGRRVGWMLSMPILLRARPKWAALFGVLWGGLVAVLMFFLIQWLSPGVLLRWVMGYALASYVAIPHYGLVNRSQGLDAPFDNTSTVLTLVPLIVFVIAMVALTLAFKVAVGHV